MTGLDLHFKDIFDTGVEDELENVSVEAQVLSGSFLNFLLFYKFIYFIYLFLAARGLSLVAVSQGYSSLRCAGFSLWWLLLLWSTGSRRPGFSGCGVWA